MSNTTNVRAVKFARRELFVTPPDETFMVASIAASKLAHQFCTYDQCETAHQSAACRLHSRAMVLGLSKMIVGGEVLAELSHQGVLFVRLSPKGVLEPSGWSSPPFWYGERPELVEWARDEIQRRMIASDVERWESRV